MEILTKMTYFLSSHTCVQPDYHGMHAVRVLEMMCTLRRELLDGVRTNHPRPDFDPDFALRFIESCNEADGATGLTALPQGPKLRIRILVLFAPTAIDEEVTQELVRPMMEDLAHVLRAAEPKFCRPKGAAEAEREIQQWSAQAGDLRLLVFSGHGQDGAWAWPASTGSETTTYVDIKRIFLDACEHNFVISDCCDTADWADQSQRVCSASTTLQPDTLMICGLIIRLWWAIVLPATSARSRRARVRRLRRIRNVPNLLQLFPRWS